MLLASVGDSLKIWSSNESDPSSLVSKSRYESKKDSVYQTVSWNHTNQVVAIGGNDPKVDIIQVNNACALGSPIQLWDMKKRQIKAVFTGHSHPIVSLGFLPSGEVYAADASGKVKLWSAKSSTAAVHELVDDSSQESRSTIQLSCMAMSSISPVLTTGYSDGSLKVWDALTGSHADTLLRNQRCHRDRVTAIACSPKNSRLIASVSLDGKLSLIDTGSKTMTDVCAGCQTEEVLTALSFHEDGIHSVVGTTEGRIILYDWRNLAHPIVTIPAHSPRAVNALAYQVKVRTSSDSFSVASSSSNLVSETHQRNSSITPTSSVASLSASANSRTIPDMKGTSLSTATSSSAAPATLPETVFDGRRLVLAPSPPPKIRPTTPSIHQETSMGVARPPPLPPALPTLSQSHKSTESTTASASMGTVALRQSAKSESLFDNQSLDDQIPPTTLYDERVKAFLDVGLAKPSLPKVIQEERSTVERNNENSVDLSLRQSSLRAEVERSMNESVGNKSFRKNVGSEFIVSPVQEEIRQAVQPVTSKELEDALDLLRYDIHMEMQEVIKEQVRQFVIAKEETAQLVRELSMQLADLLQANRELREENEKLRRIY
eukprot:scaffold424_cov165-Ochromonas_danica.AAC.32